MLRKRPSVAALLASLALPCVALADVVPSPPNRVARETGSGSTSATDTRWQIGGTDLGVAWDDGAGRMLVAYGDTYATAGTNGPSNVDWRRGGVLGASTDRNPWDGLAFDSFVTDRAGHAGPAVVTTSPVPSSNPPPPGANPEFTVIPTAGASIDGVDFIHFMSVHQWCSPGLWSTSQSGIAWRMSGTNGALQRIPPGTMSWGPTSNFAMAAFLRRGDYVYMFGTPPGREGGIKLARARGSLGVAYDGWEYWDGATWQGDESRAAFVAPAPAGELSAQYDPAFGRYLLVYGDMARNELVLRDAPSIEGPYTEEKTILDGSVYPGSYGGFMLPFSVGGAPLSSGGDLFFSLSEWGPYDVTLMHASLAWRAQDDDLVTDGGFEQQLDASVASPWVLGGVPSGGIDVCRGFAHGGSNDAWLRSSDRNWHDIHQVVAVKPNADYRLTFWIRSANVSAGYAGVRTTGVPAPIGGDPCNGYSPAPDSATPIREQTFGTLTSYAPITVTFNAGARSLAEIYAGFWAPGSDAWVQVDDVSLVPLEATRDGGFELQATGAVGDPYMTEGPAPKGIDRQAGFAHTGENNAWIRTSAPSQWNAITQVVAVKPSTYYRLTGWVQTSTPFGAGFFGVRDGASGTILHETSFGATAPYAQLDVLFWSGTSTSVKLYAGYWTPTTSTDTWMRVDDVSIEPW